ncbi:MAG: CBS domain-containing protein [Thermoleophilaceae bacterium]|nr:CBS domain-containing protein [Thermoleophilaceae bacterium]
MSPTSHAHPAYWGPAFTDAKVRDAMRVGVVYCRPEATPADAARIMSGYGIHSVVVADAGAARAEGPLAVVDALDVARAEADGLANVSEIETPGPHSIDADAPLAEAAAVMAENRVSHLVVVQPGTSRPVGVVSASGLLGAIAWGRA